MAAGNGGQKMSQYSWFTVYLMTETVREAKMMNMKNAAIELLTALEDGEESAREGKMVFRG